MSGSDPEETMPFTHRPYGREEPDQPWTSPSGSSGEPSGPGYVPPAVPPPPMSSTPSPAAPVPEPPYGPPYGPPPGTPYPHAYAPPSVYAAGAGSMTHQGAASARTLGIIGLVSAGLTPFCCITVLGVFCAPAAWVQGSRALKAIDAHPGHYRNRDAAQAGMVMGIIGSVIGGLMLLGLVAFSALVFFPA